MPCSRSRARPSASTIVTAESVADGVDGDPRCGQGGARRAIGCRQDHSIASGRLWAVRRAPSARCSASAAPSSSTASVRDAKAMTAGSRCTSRTITDLFRERWPDCTTIVRSEEPTPNLFFVQHASLSNYVFRLPCDRIERRRAERGVYATVRRCAMPIQKPAGELPTASRSRSRGGKEDPMIQEFHTVQICGLTRNLPLFEVAPEVRIAIFNMLGDYRGGRGHRRRARSTAARDADAIMTAEVKSIPLAHAAGRADGDALCRRAQDPQAVHGRRDQRRGALDHHRRAADPLAGRQRPGPGEGQAHHPGGRRDQHRQHPGRACASWWRLRAAR